jgi:biopolymer transport protein ExbD
MPGINRLRRKKRSRGEQKMNITSMMDMFTIILVFLLKSYSSQGQLVTPNDDLKIPDSNVKKSPVNSIELAVSYKTDKKDTSGMIMVEGKPIMSVKEMMRIDGYLVPALQEVLQKYSTEARAMAEQLSQEFKGDIVIQGDQELPYMVLTKLMYTCGQSGFPNMNLLVYKKEN